MQVPVLTVPLTDINKCSGEQGKAWTTSYRVSKAQVVKGLTASELKHFSEGYKSLLEDCKQEYSLIRFAFRFKGRELPGGDKTGAGRLVSLLQ